MIIKQYSTMASYASFDPNKLYDRLKDKYKNINIITLLMKAIMVFLWGMDLIHLME